MKVIQKIISNLKGADYYTKHLSIINPFMPVELTPKEREVLGLFMSFKGTLAEEDRFGTTFRKEVKKQLNMSDGGLGNHISALKTKGAVDEGLDGRLAIKQFLFPENQEQFYQFKLIKDVN